MDFILNKADIESDGYKLEFFNDEMECDSSSPSSDEEDFIEDECSEEVNECSFYRSFDNREEFSRFKNQIKNPAQVSQRSEDNFFGEDDLPELFDPEQRKDVNFHAFEMDKERAENFRRTLRCFLEEVNNPFFMLLFMA